MKTYKSRSKQLNFIQILIFSSVSILSFYTISEQTFYYQPDILGSITSLTDATGHFVESKRYDAFGKQTEQTGASENHVGFTGAVKDINTELNYMQARYQSSDTGSFLSQDSVLGDPQQAISLNRYAYANQNPGVYTDPSGHLAGLVAGVVLAGMVLDLLRNSDAPEEDFSVMHSFEKNALWGLAGYPQGSRIIIFIEIKP